MNKIEYKIKDIKYRMDHYCIYGVIQNSAQCLTDCQFDLKMKLMVQLVFEIILH